MQAKHYATGCAKTIGITIGMWNGFAVPSPYRLGAKVFLLAEGGGEKYYSRELFEFHTPDALEELFERDYTATRNRLAHLPFEMKQLRSCQKEAVSAIENARTE